MWGVNRVVTSKKSFFRNIRDNRVFLVMLLPAILYFVVFLYIPMVGVILAFKDYKYNLGIFGSPWVGFKNFRFLIKSGALLHITENTILYNIAFFLVNDSLAIAVAVFINELIGKFYKKFCQSLMFLPYFISYVVVGAFVYNIFNYEFGILNTFLKSIGKDPVDVYSMPHVWKYIIVFFNTWRWLGYSSVVYLATATSIDPQLYEASKIDGANIWQRTFHITLPHLVSIFVILALFKIGMIVRGQFDLFYNIIGNNAQLFDSTDVIDTYVFRALVYNFDVGMGTAIGLYQSVFGLLLVLVSNYIVKRYREDYALF